MAEPLKNHFDVNIPIILASHIKKYYSKFDEKSFIHDSLIGFQELELIGRGKHLAHILKSYLPEDFEVAAQILMESMAEPLVHTENAPMRSFFFMPHLNYVEFYGLEKPKIALQTLHFMTQQFSAEFAIRPFIEHFPKLSFNTFSDWVSDESVHVRRLVSEGTRPRLPWASKLKDLEQNPAPVLPFLEVLKDDSEIYVRRSVANHLNDITKTHPVLVLNLCRNWKDNSNSERTWILNQALRTLIKKGNQQALALIGMDTKLSFSLENTSINKSKINLGERIQFSAEIRNTSNKYGKVAIDYVIYFMKANGTQQPKVFKLGTKEIKANETISITKSHTFAELTTRKHYQGKHRIEIQLNGKTFPLGEFVLEI